MTFRMPELIIESIVRDGLDNARRDLSIIDDVFGDFTRAYCAKKYGVSEIDKIKSIVSKKELNIVHSFNLVHANLPCVSIQLADDRESTENAHLGNYVGVRVNPYTTPEQLASLVVVGDIPPYSYNTLTGIVQVADSVNLSRVHTNLLFKDVDGNEFPILGGIVNTLGSKQFIIDMGAAPNTGAGASIQSSIDYDKYLVNGNVEDTQLIVGVHTKEPLLTKYLYTLIKYFTLSRRADLLERGLNLNTYSGSDFSRDTQYAADEVFTRFLHIRGLVQHSWRHDKVQLIDNVEINVKVPKDRLGTDELNMENQTITVAD